MRVTKLYQPYELRQFEWLYCPTQERYIQCGFNGIIRGLRGEFDLALYTSLSGRSSHSTASRRLARSSLYREKWREMHLNQHTWKNV